MWKPIPTVASRGILEGVGKPEAEALSVHTLCGHQALAGKPPRTTRCTGALLNIAKGSEGFRAKHTHQSQDTWRIIPVSKGKVACKQLWWVYFRPFNWGHRSLSKLAFSWRWPKLGWPLAPPTNQPQVGWNSSRPNKDKQPYLKSFSIWKWNRRSIIFCYVLLCPFSYVFLPADFQKKSSLYSNFKLLEGEPKYYVILLLLVWWRYSYHVHVFSFTKHLQKKDLRLEKQQMFWRFGGYPCLPKWSKHYVRRCERTP